MIVMKTHIFHYLILASILFGGVFTFIFLAGNRNAQIAIGVITSLSYVAWGIIHHAIDKDFHLKVMIEYTLIGLVAIILLFIVIR